MPFIPHTESDVRDMLATIGAPSINALFDEIPAELIAKGLHGVPEGLAEMDIARLMHARAAQDGQPLNFIGAGAYEHHIPAAVWEITTRGEFYSAYTPYQAEASQGTLQLLYEFQSMMTALTGMDVSNASMYDGASALAEAILMAVRSNPKGSPDTVSSRSEVGAGGAAGAGSINSESALNDAGARGPKVLMPKAVHPYYREAVHAITEALGVQQIALDYDPARGETLAAQLKQHEGQGITALVIAQPNFFGVLEDVDTLTDWAHANGAMVVAVVNPLSLALLKPPGEWGTKGADIVCGDGQPLGAPMSSGGPYFGFLTAKQQFVRQMPGRIVGRTVDVDGKPGFTLTLQAREQHIRRSKATSNICTNQGLLVTAATIHMSMLGAEGLARAGAHSVTNTRTLVEKLTAIDGVEAVFTGDRFHEAVIRLPQPAGPVLEKLAKQDVLGGFDLSRHYPELGNAVLVCATETKNEVDLDRYATALHKILAG